MVVSCSIEIHEIAYWREGAAMDSGVLDCIVITCAVNCSCVTISEAVDMEKANGYYEIYREVGEDIFWD